MINGNVPKFPQVPQPSPRWIIAAVAATVILLLFPLLKPWAIVEPGTVGVVVRLGAVKPSPLAEGVHFRWPIIERVEQMDTRLTAASATAASASKDLQTVQTQVTLQYSLSGDMAPATFQKIGIRTVVSRTVVEPAIQESVKAVTAKHTAEELVTHRAEVKFEIQEAIQRFIEVTLEEKKLERALTIANVAITDFAFSQEFNNAIELKVRAEQEALQAKNEKVRRVTQAEAAAAEIKLAAEAEAYQIEFASKARADAIEREAKALKGNAELIQLRLAERWNGSLPSVTGGGAIPFIDAEQFMKR